MGTHMLMGQQQKISSDSWIMHTILVIQAIPSPFYFIVFFLALEAVAVFII